MEMAFGLVQLGVAAAALGDADSALTCVEWLAVEHWTPALTTTHDAGRIFNLDPSGGLPAVVASMLFSSSLDSALLFPALPDQWRSGGSITGLTGRGGIVVERLEWHETGARVVLRRRPEVAWLKPDLSLRLRAGSGFTFAGGATDLVIDIGAESGRDPAWTAPSCRTTDLPLATGRLELDIDLGSTRAPRVLRFAVAGDPATPDPSTALPIAEVQLGGGMVGRQRHPSGSSAARSATACARWRTEAGMRAAWPISR